MFTMTIHDAKWKVLAYGQSLEGEAWEQTFLRLYQAMLPKGASERRLATNEKLGRQSGLAFKAARVGYTDSDGQVKTDPAVKIHTIPPQF